MLLRAQHAAFVGNARQPAKLACSSPLSHALRPSQAALADAECRSKIGLDGQSFAKETSEASLDSTHKHACDLNVELHFGIRLRLPWGNVTLEPRSQRISRRSPSTKAVHACTAPLQGASADTGNAGAPKSRPLHLVIPRRVRGSFVIISAQAIVLPECGYLFLDRFSLALRLFQMRAEETAQQTRRSSHLLPEPK